jgi:hypothetical protein
VIVSAEPTPFDLADVVIRDRWPRIAVDLR